MMDSEVLDARPLFEVERAQRRRAKALPFTMLADIDPHPVKQWLVRGLLGTGELSCLYGAPGCGKSVLAGDLAFAVAAGGTWFGRRISQGPVLYVAAERAPLVKRRFAALRIAKGVKSLPLAIAPAAIDLRSREGREAIVATAEELAAAAGEPLALVVIDTVAQTLMGGDENSAVDMGLFLANVQRLQKETGAHVLLIHHSPIESPNRLRGHSSLLAALDVSILVRKVGEQREAQVVKANDLTEEEALAFDLESVSLGQGLDGDETTAPIVVPVERDSVTKRDMSRPSRLPASVEIARRALLDAIVAHGRPPPAGREFPSGVKVISVDEWRDHAYRAGITNSDDPGAKRQAFKRANEQLKARGLMGEWEGLVWSAET